MRVDKGLQGVDEINDVVFDPKKVTVEQMEQWLKEAGTYIRTLQRPGQNKQ